MRSVHGTFATLLLMVPVLSIPALAIFGIPQFAPVVASPLDERPKQDRERRVGQSARLADDSLDDLEEAPPFGADSSERDDAPPGRLGDSVPLTRPGRNASPPNSFPTVDPRQPTRPQKTPKSRWMDDVEAEKLQTADLKGLPKQSADRSGMDERDSRTDSRQPGLYDALERAPLNPGAADQRAYQRQRNPQPEPAGNVKTVSFESEPLTWKSAVQRLNDMEIRNFRLQPGHRDNQFVFICSYTPSDSPRVSYRFEAEADEPLKAVEKVLEQILEWQQRR